MTAGAHFPVVEDLRGMSARLALNLALCAGVALVFACESSSGTPTCSQACAQTSHGEKCLTACVIAPAAGFALVGAGGIIDAGTCPSGEVCTEMEACCSGAACSGAATFVCCHPSGC